MGRSLARDIRYRGAVENRYEADDLLEQPGDSVTVIRGRPRSFVMACPDGCGSVLTVNLDSRAGKAWRLYERGGLTLSPSVWRDSGCQSHFIVWRSRIVWCDADLLDGRPDPVLDKQIGADVLAQVRLADMTSEEIAGSLDAIPYDVDLVLTQLVSDGAIERLPGKPARFSIPTQTMSDAKASPTLSAPSAPPRRSWWRRLWGKYWR